MRFIVVVILSLISVSLLAQLPSNSKTGDMTFWNGNDWVVIDHGVQGQILTFCENGPRWTYSGVCCPALGEYYAGGIIFHLDSTG